MYFLKYYCTIKLNTVEFFDCGWFVDQQPSACVRIVGRRKFCYARMHLGRWITGNLQRTQRNWFVDHKKFATHATQLVCWSAENSKNDCLPSWKVAKNGFAKTSKCPDKTNLKEMGFSNETRWKKNLKNILVPLGSEPDPFRLETFLRSHYVKRPYFEVPNAQHFKTQRNWWILSGAATHATQFVCW